jgi:hypothetical protein
LGRRSCKGRQAHSTAYDVKEVHRLLRGFSDGDLKRIPVLPEGSGLEQRATYVDVADLDRGL